MAHCQASQPLLFTLWSGSLTEVHWIMFSETLQTVSCRVLQSVAELQAELHFLIVRTTMHLLDYIPWTQRLFFCCPFSQQHVLIWLLSSSFLHVHVETCSGEIFGFPGCLSCSWESSKTCFPERRKQNFNCPETLLFLFRNMNNLLERNSLHQSFWVMTTANEIVFNQQTTVS